MSDTSLAALARAAEGGRILGDPATPVAELAYRADAVSPGALFICVRGATVDGHDFAPQAVERGAAGLAVEHELGVSVPQLVVSDTRAAMPLLARAFFGDPSAELDVVGVTGTSGKTTTAFLVSAILEAAGRRPGLIGTIESRVGNERRPAVRTTPESVDLQRTLREMLEAGNRSCALEATSHGSELGRLDGVRFAALGFTNLGRDHLDFHGTTERYFEAKRRLFVRDPRPPAAVNVGDEWGRRLAAELRGQTELVTWGFADDADLRPDELELSAGGASFRAGGLEVHTRLRGRFNVENALCAIALARLAGVDDSAIVEGLSSVQGVPGRFEPVGEGQLFTVVVDYSHKPEALANVLATARELATGRVICVFGAGGDRDRTKRPVMGEIAARLADVAILTSDNPRSEDPQAIADEVAAGAPGELTVELDRRRAIAAAVELARPGDVVVIAGKGHEQGQEIAGRIHPFDDREVARDALQSLVSASER
jgi:UDP-N-acetylmuramoyl-L-alanyl-D-glutamate--2,6-diaminopimelate ligase